MQPLGSTRWTRLVRRRSREEDAQGRKDGAFEEEQPEDEPLDEDDEGHQHIDIRV